MEEIWKQVIGHPLYLVSNRGRIASIMVLRNNSVGRHMVNLTLGLKKGSKHTGVKPKKPIIVHRAVLEAFVGPPPFPSAVCRHKNDVPNDNRVENLEWGSKSDNAIDAIKNGRWGINENSVKAKLSNKDVHIIRIRYDVGEPLKNIAADFGVCVPHICGIGKRKFWKHLPEDEDSWAWAALKELQAEDRL